MRGGSLGVVGGALGAPRAGKACRLRPGRRLIALGVAGLVAGVVALRAGQPYGVWFGFLLPGGQLPIILACLLPVVASGYRKAEMRKMEAQDL